MQKTKINPPKGFRDFLPQKMIIRDKVMSVFKEIFEKYGFDQIQTPAIEYEELLLGKYGEEAEKLIYRFSDRGKRKLGLRYDLTVPLARVISNYQESLSFPFKRYQIQPVWRAEKPQRGRYREIFQCDIDIVGSSSPLADAEIISIIYEALNAIKINDFQIKINSRKVLFAVMEKVGIKKEKWLEVIRIIDKLDKKPKDKIIRELYQKGMKKEEIESLFTFLKKSKPDSFLEEVIGLASKMGVKNLLFDPALSRGLDYYTGPIFETIVKKPKIGSVTGGGRYDNLLKNLTGKDYPATGSSIGLDRICDVIEEKKLLSDKKTKTKVLVTVFSKDFLNNSLEILKILRKNNINSEVYLDPNTKLEKQIKYADKKGVQYVIFIGPEEVKNKIVTIKDLTKKEQRTFSFENISSFFS